MSYLLDTGILLRLPNRNDPEHHNVRRAIREIKQTGEEMVTLTQNLAEFWSVCTRRYRLAAVMVFQFLKHSDDSD
jgi:predicted nucleic acid-binding protein